MTSPKDQYETRKAIRKAQRDKGAINHVESELAVQDCFDRMATAWERIADAMEVMASPPKGVAHDPEMDKPSLAQRLTRP